MRDMEEKTGIPVTDLQVTEATPQLWDSCLNLPFLDTPCSQIGIPGWRVVVEGSQQRWVYHATEKEGFKLNAIASLSTNLTEEVLADVAWRSEIPISQLKVIWVESKTWSNGCLGLPTMGSCTMALVPGWRVIVSDGSQQRWVYRTALSHGIRYDTGASTITRNIPVKFPNYYGELVLEDMAKKSSIPIEQLQIVKAENKTWDECQGTVKPINPCATLVVPVSLWQVTVEGLEQRWIYQVSDREVKLLALPSLPRTLRQGIIETTKSYPGFNQSQLKFLSVEQKIWQNTCMDIKNDFCSQLEFPGWQITVTDGQNRLVYHTGLISMIRLNPTVSSMLEKQSKVLP